MVVCGFEIGDKTQAAGTQECPTNAHSPSEYHQHQHQHLSVNIYIVVYCKDGGGEGGQVALSDNGMDSSKLFEPHETLMFALLEVSISLLTKTGIKTT